MANNRPKLVVLSGAGISAESGIATFRDSNGLWENHRIEDVATPEAWAKDPQLVLAFYNLRRSNVQQAKPNEAHLILQALEQNYDVHIITQNVDDLHERAGSSQVLHLHGELMRACSSVDKQYSEPCTTDITWGQQAADGSQLRPDIVWFGEAVPMLEEAVRIIEDAAIIVVVGTSMMVYPAASLIHYGPKDSQYFYIDPKPNSSTLKRQIPSLTIIPEVATVGMNILYQNLTKT